MYIPRGSTVSNIDYELQVMNCTNNASFKCRAIIIQGVYVFTEYPFCFSLSVIGRFQKSRKLQSSIFLNNNAVRVHEFGRSRMQAKCNTTEYSGTKSLGVLVHKHRLDTLAT